MRRRDFFKVLAAPAVVAFVATSAKALHTKVGPTMRPTPGDPLLYKYKDGSGRQFRMLQAQESLNRYPPLRLREVPHVLEER